MTSQNTTIIDLIHKYNKPGPRYTSYPSANNFTDYTPQEYQNQVLISNQSNRNLSIYCHIPFCQTACFYCGCHKIFTKDQNKTIPYLNYLFKEIDLQAALFDKSRLVVQCHLGGGTPTFLANDQLSSLMQHLKKSFNFADDGEYSIEIDPRRIGKDTIKTLAESGFNRISLGVQDFNSEVQKAVNRIQSFEETQRVVDYSKKYQCAVSLDLIYGLPKQNQKTFSKTLEQVIELDPDRISLFNYAHLPSLFRPQRYINEEELPNADEKIAILQMSINFLIEQGYVYIGMDHFAKPNDDLTIAQQQGSLHRNFQGYSTYAQCDIIGLGASSIGQINDTFNQNHKGIKQYYTALENEQIPITKGYTTTQDDRIRGAVIMALICHFHLNFTTIEKQFNLTFKDYFSDELSQIALMQKDGILQLNDNAITVLQNGRLLIRNICMVFDAHLNKSQTRFSKTI